MNHIFDEIDKNPTVPIDAHLVMLDWTEYYEFEEKHKPYIKQIRSIYLYDKNELTHLCEITPSYWLIHLYDTVLLTPEGYDLPEDEQSEIHETYGYCPQDDIYVHCHEIDAIEEKDKDGKKFRHHAYGATNVSFEDTPREEQMEALREHFCGNQCL